MSHPIGRLFFPSLLSLGLLAGCSAGAEKASLPPPSQGGANVGVRVVQPSTRLDGGLVRATGRLVARNDARLSPKAGGAVAALLVDVGDRVKKGQPLLQIDAATASIAVEQAEAAVAVAEANLAVAQQDVERARTLSQTGGVSPAGLEKAEAAYTQAQAGLKQARAQLRNAERVLGDHTLRAPFDGVITARLVDVGEYVTTMPPTAVYELVDLDSIEVVLPVPETVVGAVQPGSIVQGVVSPSGKPFQAKVRIVGSVVDAARTVEVRADLIGERTDVMRPNAIVEVDFATGEAMSGLFLPAKSVRKEGSKRFVWVVADGKVSRRDVEAETLTPGFVRITGGLEGDVKVVADEGVSLSDGMSVRVIE